MEIKIYVNNINVILMVITLSQYNNNEPNTMVAKSCEHNIIEILNSNTQLYIIIQRRLWLTNNKSFKSQYKQLP